MILLQRPDALQAFCKQCVEKGKPCSVIPETMGQKKLCLRNQEFDGVKREGKIWYLKSLIWDYSWF